MNVFFASNEEEIIEQKNIKRRAKKIIGDVITVLLLILCVFFVFTKFIWLYPVEVNGDSMNNTLTSGDLLLVDKLSKPKRGDVIVFTLHEKAYIKRIVAVEGDTVGIWGENLYVKKAGSEVFELVTYDGVIGKTNYGNDKTFPYEWEVQENCVYVLGDNRENSTDSRAFGQIQLDLVNGVVHQFIIDNKDEPLGKFYKYL